MTVGREKSGEPSNQYKVSGCMYVGVGVVAYHLANLKTCEVLSLS